MSEPTVPSPAAEEPPKPPPPSAGPPRRPDYRSSLERVHDAITDALDALGRDGTALLDLDGDARQKANVRIAQALKYARAHLGQHMDEKERAEGVALGVIGVMAAGVAGLVGGHVMTRPYEPYAARLRDVLSRLPPGYKEGCFTSLRQVLSTVEKWAAGRPTPSAPSEQTGTGPAGVHPSCHCTRVKLTTCPLVENGWEHSMSYCRPLAEEAPPVS